MSQNKTIIPGFDYEASGNIEYDNSTQYDENAMSGLYSRSGADVNRTYIAGSPEMVQPGMTVSPAHAILHIRKDGSPAARYNVSVTDWESEYGTSVNNADARFDTLAVNENDVIKIGKHYKLLVKLFDTDAAGLDEDLEFEGMAEQPGAGTQQAGASQEPPAVSNDFYTPTRNDDNSTRTIIY